MRPYLIMAPIGDSSQLFTSWLDDSGNRCFDVLALYFGDKPRWLCPQCVAIVHQKRTGKWNAYHLLFRSAIWAAVSKPYVSYMLADDDLIMSTHVINAAFVATAAFNLTLSQPSVCNHRDSGSLQPLVIRRPGIGLRYTAFVEIMATIGSNEFVNQILMPNLEDSFTGYGLDLSWPKLLGYPRDRIAIIDAVCVFHPKFQDPKRQRVYGVEHPKGWSATQEEKHIKVRYGVEAKTWRAAGIRGRPDRHVWSEVGLQEFRQAVDKDETCGSFTWTEPVTGDYEETNRGWHVSATAQFVVAAQVLLAVACFGAAHWRRRLQAFWKARPGGTP